MAIGIARISRLRKGISVELRMDSMKRTFSLLVIVLAPFCSAFVLPDLYGQQGSGKVLTGAAEQLVAMANEARGQSGAGRLQWDDSLAAAARDHCLRMAAEGPISHRYGGEPDLSERAGQAGAHFDLIEENVAVGPNPAQIHEEWMQSPGHRANLLNPEVTSVGIAVVSARGVLYATADYSRSVQALTQTEVEERVAELVRAGGASILRNNVRARAACATDRGMPGSENGAQTGFVLRWQSSDLSRLPKVLEDKLASRQYREAAVGSCPPQGVDGTFTAYRVAVLLY
jgi:hypothetical protein